MRNGVGGRLAFGAVCFGQPSSETRGMCNAMQINERASKQASKQVSVFKMCV